jgi:hypothetical protein
VPCFQVSDAEPPDTVAPGAATAGIESALLTPALLPSVCQKALAAGPPEEMMTAAASTPAMRVSLRRRGWVLRGGSSG